MSNFDSLRLGEEKIPDGLPLESHELARTLGYSACYRDRQGNKLPIEGDRLEYLLKHFPLSFDALALGLPEGTPPIESKLEDWKLVSTDTLEANGDRYSVLRLENSTMPKLSTGRRRICKSS